MAMSEAVQEILQHIQELPEEDRLLLEQHLAQLAEESRRQNNPDRTQAALLADLRRHSYTPPPGTSESVELLRQDRER
jgi:hypothetical protein